MVKYVLEIVFFELWTKWLYWTIQRLKFFFKEYIGEPKLIPFISYPDMKTKYPNEIIDLGHQSDHVTPKKLTVSWIWYWSWER